MLFNSNIRFSSLEKEMATHSNILVWRISWTEESRGLQSTGLHRIRNDWSNLACTPILNTLSSWTNPSYTVSFLPLFLSAAFSSFLSFLLLSFLKKKKKKISFFPAMGSFLKISLEIFQSAICINWMQLQMLKSIDIVKSDEEIPWWSGG